MDSGQINQGLARILGVLERRAVWIVVCAVLPTAGVYVISKRQPAKYRATASLLFSESRLSQPAAAHETAGTGNEKAQRSTDVTLVQLGDIAEKTALGLHDGLTTQDVRRALGVSARGDSKIVDVSATASSAALAARIANAYTKRFVTEQQGANRGYFASASKRVAKRLARLSTKERAGSAGLALQGLVQSLGELSDLRSGNVRLAQAATAPTSSYSPDVSRNTTLAAALGLLLGLAITFLLERFDWRIREPEDLAATYGVPVLGEVPRSNALAHASEPGRSCSREVLPLREAEVFQLIRAHVRYLNVEREPRTLLVTSAQAGDGKTTIARHLAVAAAGMGSTVLLVEADLRNPSLAAQLDIAAGPGVADVVTGSVSLWRATQPVALARPTGVTARPLAIDVLVAGEWRPDNPAELIESHAMAALLEQASETYDLIVLDTPPLSVVSDAFPLLHLVNGVLVVGMMGHNLRPAAKRLRETLDRVRAPVLGVIANGVRARGRREPYYREADDGSASIAHDPTELAYERVPAGAEAPPASSSDLAIADDHGA